MSAKVLYPPDITTITVTGTFASLERSRSAWTRLYCQRRFGFAGTDQMMEKVSPKIWLKDGRFALKIPHSGQPGLVGDNGEPLLDPVAYKIVLQPTESNVAETLAWTMRPASLGTPVPGEPGNTTIAFIDLPIKLDEWPDQTVVINPPPTNGDGTVTYVPVASPDNTGPLGFWSPA